MKQLRALTLIVAAFAFVLAGCQSGYDADGATVSTQPRAESAQNYAPTVIGEVTSMEDDSLTLDTRTGSLVVQVTPQTEGEEMARVGEVVAVDVNRSTTGASIASVVRTPTQEELEASELDERDMSDMGGR